MPYNSCERPDSWYEPDYDPPTPADYGWVREEDIPDLDSIKDFIKGVIEAVYVTGDVEELENCLDELCGQFDLKLPAGQPVVINRQSTDFSNKLFAFGAALSRAQANQLATR